MDNPLDLKGPQLLPAWCSIALVKQFLSLLLILIGSASTVAAQEACSRVLRSPGKRLSENYQLLYSDPQTAERAAAQNFELMGLMGNLYDLHTETATGKVVLLKNKQIYKAERASQKRRLDLAPAKPSLDFLKQIERIFSVKTLSSGLVMIHFSPETLRNLDIFTERPHGLLINRFFKTYENLVAFNYRLAGIEDNVQSSSVQMMVETKILREVEKRDMNYYFVYDPGVWTNLLRLLEKEFRILEQTSSRTKANHNATWRMLDGTEALYPMASVALSSDRKNPGASIEIKRYFKNEYEDPLNLTPLIEKNDFRDRHEMLYEVFKGLPPGQPLEIHAHSIVHARAYMKLGFNRTEIRENPLYPGVQVHVLKSTREQALEKIGAVLESISHK